MGAQVLHRFFWREQGISPCPPLQPAATPGPDPTRVCPELIPFGTLISHPQGAHTSSPTQEPAREYEARRVNGESEARTVIPPIGRVRSGFLMHSLVQVLRSKAASHTKAEYNSYKKSGCTIISTQLGVRKHLTVRR